MHRVGRVVRISTTWVDWLLALARQCNFERKTEYSETQRVYYDSLTVATIRPMSCINNTNFTQGSCVWVDVSVYTMVRVPGSHVYINTELITIRVTCLITIRVTCHAVTSQESPINAPWLQSFGAMISWSASCQHLPILKQQSIGAQTFSSPLITK